MTDLSSIKAYVIYSPSRKLFSSGKSMPRWTPHGKIWTTRANLSKHIAMFLDHYGYPDADREFYDGSEIIYDAVAHEKITTIREEFERLSASRIKRGVSSIVPSAPLVYAAYVEI
jgi:hypothetical protein